MTRNTALDLVIYSVHVRTRKLRTSETPLIPRATRQLIFGFSSGRSILHAGSLSSPWTARRLDLLTALDMPIIVLDEITSDPEHYGSVE